MHRFAWTRRLGPWPYIVFTGVVFGSGGLIAKQLLDDGMDAFSILAISAAFGAATAVLHLRLVPNREQLKAGALVGLLATAVPATFFNLGFERLPAGTASLLIALGPVATAVAAHFAFADERFNRVKGAGLAMAMIGAAILGSSDSGSGSTTGVLFIVVGAIITGSGGVIVRRSAMRFGGRQLVTTQMAVACLVGTVLAVTIGDSAAPTDGWEAVHWLLIAGQGISGYFAFSAMLKANETATTGQASVIGYIVPVVGVLGGVIFFSDLVTLPIVVGGLLILAATYVIAIGSRAQGVPEPLTPAVRSSSAP